MGEDQPLAAARSRILVAEPAPGGGSAWTDAPPHPSSANTEGSLREAPNP